MKLHAFRDRKDDADKGLGRHHSLDLYRIVAMMTEVEYGSTRSMLDRHRDSEPLRAARRIVSEDFRDGDSVGVIRLKEHDLFDPATDVTNYLSVLHEFLPP